ncbi:hypothetical protein [uncultured Ruminococcus sp.]|uniref:hypothetical protein n=1 Tax=uncultured Ruminococcus sp. TaxID=165186 RepID=UPI00260801A2|nr:hypothetical protein [uncultured Ruminococcus sp.]
MSNMKDKGKKKIWIFVIVLLVVTALVISGVIVYNRFFTETPAPSQGVVGKVSDGWDTGLEDEGAVQERGIQIPGYGTAVMKAGDTSLVLSVGNPKENECGFYATVKLEDGTELYKSELLEPGYGLTEIPLSTDLKAGEYTAIVYYQCVTLDEEHSPLNSAESEFTLIVSESQ